ncbi:MAG: spore gernimation protein GerPA [Firmicutes bacterium]|nr:spore gernimation protein GerPA [Bacillota bacterium]
MSCAIIKIGNIKINSIQSGASFIIGERIVNVPSSEMVMQAGPGSMNNGDDDRISNPYNISHMSDDDFIDN